MRKSVLCGAAPLIAAVTAPFVHAAIAMEDSFQVTSLAYQAAGSSAVSTQWRAFSDRSHGNELAEGSQANFHTGAPPDGTTSYPAPGNANGIDPAGTTYAGLVFWSPGLTHVFAYTNKYAGVISSTAVSSISFDVMDYNAPDTFEAALDVDGQWYISDDVFDVNSTAWTKCILDATYTWTPLSVNYGSGGTPLAPADGAYAPPGLTDVPLPAGRIDGYGFFQQYTNGGGYDVTDYIINASVPEPSGTALVILAVAGTMRRRRCWSSTFFLE